MTDHIVIIKHPETKNIRRSFTIGSKRHGGTLGEDFYGPGPGFLIGDCGYDGEIQIKCFGCDNYVDDVNGESESDD